MENDNSQTESEKAALLQMMRCRLCGLDVEKENRAEHLKQHYGLTVKTPLYIERDFTPTPAPSSATLEFITGFPWRGLRTIEALRPRSAPDAEHESGVATQRLKNRIHGREGFGSFTDVGSALVDSVIVELLNRGHGRAAAIEIVASYLPRKLADLVEADWRDDLTREANRKQWDKNMDHG